MKSITLPTINFDYTIQNDKLRDYITLDLSVQAPKSLVEDVTNTAFSILLKHQLEERGIVTQSDAVRCSFIPLHVRVRLYDSNDEIYLPCKLEHLQPIFERLGLFAYRNLLPKTTEDYQGYIYTFSVSDISYKPIYEAQRSGFLGLYKRMLQNFLKSHPDSDLK